MKTELRSLTSLVITIWEPWAKWCKMERKSERFVRIGYSEVAFLFNGRDRHEIPAKNVNQFAISQLNRRISKQISLRW